MWESCSPKSLKFQNNQSRQLDAENNGSSSVAANCCNLTAPSKRQSRQPLSWQLDGALRTMDRDRQVVPNCSAAYTSQSQHSDPLRTARVFCEGGVSRLSSAAALAFGANLGQVSINPNASCSLAG